MLPCFFVGIVVVGFGFSFTLGLGIATNVEEDFVVEDVSSETEGPERGACPKDGSAEGVSEKDGCGGGAEVGAHQGAVDDVEGSSCDGDADVGFGTRGCAEGGDEGAVGVVDQEETGEDELGGGEWLGVDWGGCEGCIGKCVNEGDG